MIKYYYYGDPHAHIPSLATAYPGKRIHFRNPKFKYPTMGRIYDHLMSNKSIPETNTIHKIKFRRLGRHFANRKASLYLLNASWC